MTIVKLEETNVFFVTFISLSNISSKIYDLVVERVWKAEVDEPDGEVRGRDGVCRDGIDSSTHPPPVV